MQINHKIVLASSGILIPTLMPFLKEALVLMIPWFVVMLTVVFTDLASGIWKAYKLQIPIRFSRGCRDTMGKLIVYFAFVMMICCWNVAAGSEYNYSKWAALLIIVIEGGSIIGNILKPHGIDISMGAIIKAFLNHSIGPLTCPEVDEIIEKKDLEQIREEEIEKLAADDTGKKTKKVAKKSNK